MGNLHAAESKPVCAAKENPPEAPKPATPALPAVSGCLIDAQRIPSSARVIDVRSGSEFAARHIPGATNQPLASLLNRPARDLVIYDGGRLRPDAYALCERLHRYGLSGFKVIDGGIASWLQSHDAANALLPSRLSDAEVSSSLLANDSAVISLSDDFAAPLKSHGAGGTGKSTRASGRTILLVRSPEQIPTIQDRLTRKPSGTIHLYWIGTAARLDALLGTQVAQEKKRLEGPGRKAACSAL